MEVAVWDTYVKRENGKIMHFDILVPSELKDEKVIFNFGKHYLHSKSIKTGQLTAKECRLCHMEQANQKIAESIERNGCSIIEIENCD